MGLDVRGYVSSNGIGSSEDFYKSVNVIGTAREIERLIDETGAQEVIIALEKDDQDKLIQLISKCDQKNVRIKIVPRFTGCPLSI